MVRDTGQLSCTLGQLEGWRVHRAALERICIPCGFTVHMDVNIAHMDVNNSL